MSWQVGEMLNITQQQNACCALHEMSGCVEAGWQRGWVGTKQTGQRRMPHKAGQDSQGEQERKATREKNRATARQNRRGAGQMIGSNLLEGSLAITQHKECAWAHAAPAGTHGRQPGQCLRRKALWKAEVPQSAECCLQPLGPKCAPPPPSRLLPRNSWRQQ